MVGFSWDPLKDQSNQQKHKVTFGEAATVFLDPLSITISDPDHSLHEERFIIIGMSGKGRHLMVAHALRDDDIRIISARRLTRSERRQYEDEIQDRQG
jgi:hypothetical protein